MNGEQYQYLFSAAVIVFALVISAVLWLIGEVRSLNVENKLLREQRDMWIKIAIGKDNGGVILTKQEHHE